MLSHELIDSFKSSLFAGQYNLLLGSGISLDSLDKNGKNLKSASDLTKQLCEIKGVDINTPLSRVSLLLDADEGSMPFCVELDNLKDTDAPIHQPAAMLVAAD